MLGSNVWGKFAVALIAVAMGFQTSAFAQGRDHGGQWQHNRGQDHRGDRGHDRDHDRHDGNVSSGSGDAAAIAIGAIAIGVIVGSIIANASQSSSSPYANQAATQDEALQLAFDQPNTAIGVSSTGGYVEVFATGTANGQSCAKYHVYDAQNELVDTEGMCMHSNGSGLYYPISTSYLKF